MSVYIKGIKMPTSCHECPLLYVTSICDGSKDCPLVPVPPHGRMIDADALIEAHEQVCSRSMKFNLDLAPTIIPAEEGEI